MPATVLGLHDVVNYCIIKLHSEGLIFKAIDSVSVSHVMWSIRQDGGRKKQSKLSDECA